MSWYLLSFSTKIFGRAPLELEEELKRSHVKRALKLIAPSKQEWREYILKKLNNL